MSVRIEHVTVSKRDVAVDMQITIVAVTTNMISALTGEKCVGFMRPQVGKQIRDAPINKNTVDLYLMVKSTISAAAVGKKAILDAVLTFQHGGVKYLPISV